MTTPTSKPVPSNDPRDLLFNAETFDKLSTGDGYVPNRLGKSIPSYMAAIKELGFNAPVAFAAGINADSSRVTVTYSGERYFASPDATPFTTTATFNPTQWRMFDQSFAGSEVAQIGTYSLLRAYAGAATLVYVAGRLNDQDGAAGMFSSDESDTSSADNDGTVLVGANGRRWKRQLAGLPSVKMFGAIGDGSSADTAFASAALAHQSVTIPKGTYLLTVAVPTSCVWVLEKGAVITGLPNAGTAGGGVMDTSRLTGAIVSYNSGGANVVKVGSSDPWLAKGIRDTVDYLAAFASVSQVGGTGGMFATRSSDNPAPNMQTIALEAISYNDNTINPEPSWSIYTETIRAEAAGPAFGAEMDFVNLGNMYPLSPYNASDPYSSTQAPTASLWLSCGGGNSEISVGANDISAAIVTLPNLKKFNVGWIVRSGSIASYNIIMAPQSHKYVWNDPQDRTISTIDDRQHFRAVYSDTQALAVADINRKYKANGTSATTANDIIFGSSFQGHTGTTSQEGAGHYVTQRSNYLGGNAAFTQVFFAANNGGGVSDIGLNVGTDGTFSPATSDNVLGLGSAAHRWGTVYAGTGAINTSDAREKQQISELDVKEKAVALKLKKLIKRFKFNDAVKEKGASARWHFGVLAQDVMAEFESAGLNAFDYAIVCHDAWESTPEILEEDSDGNVKVKAKATAAGERFGIRYDELICFIIGAM